MSRRAGGWREAVALGRELEALTALWGSIRGAVTYVTYVTYGHRVVGLDQGGEHGRREREYQLSEEAQPERGDGEDGFAAGGGVVDVERGRPETKDDRLRAV